MNALQLAAAEVRRLARIDAEEGVERFEETLRHVREVAGIPIATAAALDEYRRAHSYATRHPAVRSPEQARHYLEARAASLAAHPWHRHRGESDRDRRVLLAVLLKAHDLGSVRLRWSRREWMRAAGMQSVRSWRAAIAALEACGFLTYAGEASAPGGRSAEVRIVVGDLRACAASGSGGGSDAGSDTGSAGGSDTGSIPTGTGTSYRYPYLVREPDRGELPGPSAEPVAPPAEEEIDAAQLRAIAAAWPPLLGDDNLLGAALARVAPVAFHAGTLTLANRPGEPFDAAVVGPVIAASASIAGALSAAGVRVLEVGITCLGDATASASVGR